MDVKLTKANSAFSGHEVRSRVCPSGRLELSLVAVETPPPAAGEIVVRVDAAPLNPSDMGLLIGPGNPAQAVVEETGASRKVVFPLAEPAVKALTRRHDLSICPGLEGAGIVIAAGEGCEHLVGKTAAMFGGRMYATHRTIDPADCLIFPEGTPPEHCAAAFVNPLTALCMIDTLRREGHRAMIHTAAASNLGQMLVKLCRDDDIPLINIVRNREQVDILRDLGARHVLDSTAPGFVADLTALIRETQATLAFDAIGGGPMASTLLLAMENVYAPEEYSIYGSKVHKQVYIYGILDPGPIQILRGAGSAWSISGWLLLNRLATLAPTTVQAMKDRVVRDLDATFASRFSAEIGLDGLLDIHTLETMVRRSTGHKYLLKPNQG